MRIQNKKIFEKVNDCLEFDSLVEVVTRDNMKLANRSGIQKTSNYKNNVMNIYTAWEVAVKESLFDYFTINKSRILDKKFITYVIYNLKSYSIKDLIDKGESDSFTLSQEILLATNNLTSKELGDLFTVLRLDFNAFTKMVNSHEAFAKLIMDVDDTGFSLARASLHQSKNAFTYLDDLVTRRNIIAHNFVVDSILSLEQMRLLGLIINEIYKCLVLFLEHCVFTSYIETRLNTEELFKVIEIIRATGKDKNPVIHISSLKDLSLKESSEIIIHIQDSGFSCVGNIVCARDSATQVINDFSPSNEYSIELLCPVKIKKGSKLSFYEVIKSQDSGIFTFNFN